MAEQQNRPIRETNPPARRDAAETARLRANLAQFFAMIQAGVEATRAQRTPENAAPLVPPVQQGPFFIKDYVSPPDAGDLYDYNYSNGDPGILGLFGSAVPQPELDPLKMLRRANSSSRPGRKRTP